jgi:hypothetical protein
MFDKYIYICYIIYISYIYIYRNMMINQNFDLGCVVLFWTNPIGVGHERRMTSTTRRTWPRCEPLSPASQLRWMMLRSELPDIHNITKQYLWIIIHLCKPEKPLTHTHVYIHTHMYIYIKIHNTSCYVICIIYKNAILIQKFNTVAAAC